MYDDYAVCSMCAPGVAYGDWTAYHTGTQKDHAATVEKWGMVALAGTRGYEYCECSVCEMPIESDEVHIFEPVN